MEGTARPARRNALYTPAKFCIAFIVASVLGILLAYCLMQLTARPPPPPQPLATVGTTSGPVQGVAGRGWRFYGLPYAQPPLGAMRFKDPQLPPPSWNSTFTAKTRREACLVLDRRAEGGYVGAEDCLYLDVHTPRLEGAAPVLVWLGDGTFGTHAAAPRTPRADRLLDGGVVVVTVQYRRGVLGFLSDSGSGNYGLKDQVAALRWVRDNIAAFGGDPTKVTIFGVGAGAASVGLHMLSPLSSGLFSRAIAMGGSPLNPWAFNHDTRKSAVALDTSFPGVGNWTDSAVVDYLRNLSVKELVATLPEVYKELGTQETHLFLPSLERPSVGAFMTDPPWRVLIRGLPNAVPFLTGSTSAEGKRMLKATRLAALERNLLKLLSPSLDRSRSWNYTREAQLVRSFYFGDDPIDTANSEDVLNLLTDMNFLEGVDRMARLVAALSPYPVYYYHYTYERNNTQDSTGLPGAMPGEDAYAMLYSTDDDRAPDPLSEAEINNTWFLILMSFIKHGNPAEIQGVRWPPYTEDDPAYLEVGAELRARRNLLGARMDFWRSLLPLPPPPQV